MPWTTSSTQGLVTARPPTARARPGPRARRPSGVAAPTRTSAARASAHRHRRARPAVGAGSIAGSVAGSVAGSAGPPITAVPGSGLSPLAHQPRRHLHRGRPQHHRVAPGDLTGRDRAQAHVQAALAPPVLDQRPRARQRPPQVVGQGSPPGRADTTSAPATAPRAQAPVRKLHDPTSATRAAPSGAATSAPPEPGGLADGDVDGSPPDALRGLAGRLAETDHGRAGAGHGASPLEVPGSAEEGEEPVRHGGHARVGETGDLPDEAGDEKQHGQQRRPARR